MELHYVGAHTPGAAIPLPEGWPAFDHSEADKDTAAAKLASGSYVAVKQSAPGKKVATNKEDGD